jgi:DNA adenine methylase
MRIAGVIESLAEPARWGLASPFCGGLSVELRLTGRFPFMLLSDLSPDLIAMWSGLSDGWRPPASLSEQEYNALKSAEPSALRGFAGFGSSFGGKWFAGYGRTTQPERNGGSTTVAEQSARTVVKDINLLSRSDATFRCGDYRDLALSIPHPSRVVVYADPPYAGTLGYAAVGEFDSDEFWRTADQWVSLGFQVFVSEERAPDHWRSVWRATVPGSMDHRKRTRSESLFTRDAIR